MFPAQERLKTGDRSGADVYLRLVLEKKFVAGEHLTQTVFQRQPLHESVIHLFREDRKAVWTVFARAAHGYVGPLHQRFAIRSVFRKMLIPT